MKIFGKSSSKAKRGAARGRKNNRSRPQRRGGRSRARGAGQSAGILKMAAAIAAPAAALGIAGYCAITWLDTEEPDANHCYARDDQHQAVIFVDNSIENESGAQFRDYRAGLMRVYDNAPANSLIRIASTNRTQGGSFAQPQFTICKPASTPAEQEAIGAPQQPAPMLARIHDEARTEYAEMVETVISDAANPSKAAMDSPIFEQLQAISRYDGFTGPNRSLTSITDGISNSEAGRFCVEQGALVPFERFKLQRRYLDVEPRSFDGLDVTLLLVELGQFPAPGAPYCSNEELRDFWPDYFTANGAVSVDLRRLRYWQDS